jgi:hypothetical protein
MARPPARRRRPGGPVTVLRGLLPLLGLPPATAPRRAPARVRASSVAGLLQETDTEVTTRQPALSVQPHGLGHG